MFIFEDIFRNSNKYSAEFYLVINGILFILSVHCIMGLSLEMCTKLNAVFPFSRNNDIMSKRVTLMRVMSETRCEMTQYKMDTPFIFSYYTKSQGLTLENHQQFKMFPPSFLTRYNLRPKV